jgi:hypothetical protein
MEYWKVLPDKIDACMMNLFCSFQWKISFLGIFILCASCTHKINFLQKHQAPLASPIIESDAIFFAEDLEVKLNLALDNVEIRYTLDDSEPTVSSSLFSNKIILSESANLKARAFHSDYLPSETISTQFVKINSAISVEKISINRETHKKYQGKGSESLIDYVKGTKDFKSDAWLGFAGGDLEIILECSRKEMIGQVVVSLLSDQKSWIFLPEIIEIYTANQGEKFTLVATKKNSDSEFRFSEMNFEPINADYIKVVLKNISEIPDWHPGKGTLPWLFIDEVLLK